MFSIMSVCSQGGVSHVTPCAPNQSPHGPVQTCSLGIPTTTWGPLPYHMGTAQHLLQAGGWP